MTTKKKKSGATSSAAAAAKRALAFLAEAEKAEAADAKRAQAFIETQRAALAPQVEDWQRGPEANKPEKEPRTVDGCTLAQLKERTDWEGTRPQIVAPVFELARQIVNEAAKAGNAMDFYNVAQAKRATFPGEQLGKLRGKEARTAFDQAFKRPE